MAPSRHRDSGSGGRRRRSRTPSRRRASAREADADAEPYTLEVLRGRHQEALPMHHIAVAGETEDSDPIVVPHVCAVAGEGYALRVANRSRRHVACAVYVDGETTLLRDGSLIVAPGDYRELPGYLVSKNFVGREYVKEYRDFRFGKPKVVEGSSGTTAGGSSGSGAQQHYASYGAITCDVYEAVVDEEVSEQTELRGQTTFYRGAGLHGSNEEREIEEGKKSHLLYSSVTVQGPRSSISNSTAGRWWVRGTRKLASLEVRYREAHSLMLLGVNPRELGIVMPKAEGDDDRGKFGMKALKDEWTKDEKEEEDEEKFGDSRRFGARHPDGLVQSCDLTMDSDEDEERRWTLERAAPRAEPVDVA
eukprot:TRINITY_DN26414_c0_g1_i1.p1 TRINITY_DN26414_c0_g1~~TRINITY_DN26414_c0_g1_i1.p1  ORF type:complete len:391 (+),score=98.00 TRINITY_DN26414_c0_g1_i1:86-1174(+)